MIAAKAQIEQEIQQAKESLRKEVSALALSAAEQILGAEIDKAKHQDILNKVSKSIRIGSIMSELATLASPYATAVFKRAKETHTTVKVVADVWRLYRQS